MRVCHAAWATLALTAACAAAWPSNYSQDTSFDQYNSTGFLYKSSPSLATWEHVPFNGSINSTVYVPSSDAFVFVASDGTEATLWYFANSAAPTAQQFAQIVSLGSRHCRVKIADNTSDVVWYVCQDPKTFTAAASWCVISPQGQGVTCNLPEVAVNGLGPTTGNFVDYAIMTAAGGFVNAVLVGTDRQLFYCLLGTGDAFECAPMTLPNTNGTMTSNHQVASLYCIPGSVPTTSDDFLGAQCFAATRNQVCFSNICPADMVHLIAANGQPFHFIRVPGVIDDWPREMVYDRVDDSVHFANWVAVNSLARNGSLHRVGGVHAGLPQVYLTSTATSEHGVWFGGAQGVSLRKRDGTWRYFFGPRWLPGRHAAPDDGMYVTNVAVSTNGDAFVVTRMGVALIRRMHWTLADKTEHLQSWMWAFDRFGLSPASNNLAEWGNPYSVQRTSNSNEGLWTSMYMASQAFRYAATGDESARTNAWNAFLGLEQLCLCTGIRGLCPREISPANKSGQHAWYPCPNRPGWWFNGDPSSDEVTGHLHGYPIVWDLVAKTQEEKDRVAALLNNITANIVDGGLILHDITGKPTRWGRWNPETLNNQPFWYDERGANSLQILGFLSSAYRITQNSTYYNIFINLVEEHRYDLNIVNLKITQPNDVDYSDDELIYLAYLCLQWSSRPTPLMATNPLWELVKNRARVSMERTYDYVHRERPDLWSAIYLMYWNGTNAKPSVAPRASTAIGDLRWCLQTWSVSIVAWEVNNTARTDVISSPYQNRNDVYNQLLVTLLPYDETPVQVWNSNPFDKSGGSAWSVANPSFYLYPYWLSRWLGVI